MPFSTVPYLHGEGLTYRGYFLLLFSSGFAAAALECFALGAVVLCCAARERRHRGLDDDPLRGAGAIELQGARAVAGPNAAGSNVARQLGCCNRGARIAVWVLLSLAGPLLAVAAFGVGLAGKSYTLVAAAAAVLLLPPAVWVFVKPLDFASGRSLAVLGHVHLAFGLALPSWLGFLPMWATAVFVLLPLGFIFFPAKSVAGWGRGCLLAAVLGLALADAFMCFMLDGACLSLYTEEVQGSFFTFAGTAWVSTSWSRGSTKCRGDSGSLEPCYFYLTLAEDASSSVFVNVHLPSGVGQVRIFASCAALHDDPASSCLPATAAAVAFETDFLREGRRSVHSALLTNLSPDTEYKLMVEVQGKNATSLPHWRFWTAPAPGSGKEVQFVFGGDMGSSTNSSKLVNLSLDQKLSRPPAAVVIGGDIAYDNGMPHCWSAWDDWLDRWEAASRRSGKLVPVVLAVGNHDTGTEAVAGKKPPSILKEQSLFLAFFPQHAAPAPAAVPPPSERRGHHIHRVGDALLLLLDSGYLTASWGGSEQLRWAAAALREDAQGAHPAAVRLASYHVPIYPSSLHRWLNGEWQKGPSAAFAPLFDAHGVPMAFENHVHAFKRTEPLFGHRAVPGGGGGGTVYLGDGRAGLAGIGVPSQDELVTRGHEPRLATPCQARNHVWLLGAQGPALQVRAVDPEGEVFDACNMTAPQPSAATAAAPPPARGAVAAAVTTA